MNQKLFLWVSKKEEKNYVLFLLFVTRGGSRGFDKCQTFFGFFGLLQIMKTNIVDV